jgi:hypothetical protein
MACCRSAECRSETGRALLKTAASVVLLAVVGWLGYKLVPLYYYYLDLRNQCAQVIKEQAAVASDEEIRRVVGRVIKRHGIPAEERDLVIERRDADMKIELPYREKLELSVMGYTVTLWQFDLVASAEGRFK